MEDIFAAYDFGAKDRSTLDRDGHFVFPGLLTTAAQNNLTQALSEIQALMPVAEDYKPNHYAAEYNAYLASLIAPPQLLGLAREVLGEPLRFDHCVTLNRPGGDGGAHWHSHEYGERDPSLGFLRIFFMSMGLLRMTMASRWCRVVTSIEIRPSGRARTTNCAQSGWRAKHIRKREQLWR
ncbi:MAG: hypothetical protein ACKVJG_26840 [Candidatus Latescibacterota bacterium]|jgi:hypothetical protein